MTKIGTYKRISELPAGSPENVQVLGITSTGANVRVPYDVQQVVGLSTTSTMSQAAITSELAKRDKAIENLKVGAIGIITSPDDTIAVESTETGLEIGVNANKLILANGGLRVVENRIGLAIDNSEGNLIYQTDEGALRVDGDNYWLILK
jgi:hypothetical protein